MIKRNLLQQLKAHLSQKEISLIIGPRQCGKTTLMTLLEAYLSEKGQRTLFLSLDFESDQPHFVSQAALISKLRLELGDRGGYVFIDEIQRRENAGLFLKGLYDLDLPYKFVVSGSGSLELKEKIHESLAGRKRLFELSTISFEEFVNFRTEYRYIDRLHNFFRTEREKLQDLRNEYLNFGGYPRVVLDVELQEKIRTIDEIYRSYLERDIAYLMKVEKLDAFRSLVTILASQIGQLINFSELSSLLGINSATLKKYYYFLKKTFIIHEVTPYYTNIKKEIKKSPICYFFDIGLRNYATGLFGNINTHEQAGFLFENIVFNILKDRCIFTPVRINFWRTKDGAEVDFVLNTGLAVLPVEVKYKKFRKPAVSRSLRSFINKYSPKEAWIINLDFDAEIKINGTIVRFFPFYELLTITPQCNINILPGQMPSQYP